MLKNLILIAISVAIPPLLFFTVPYMIYLFLTFNTRKEKYFTDAIIWRTGGLFGTGDIDINKSVSLYKKASSMGHAEAAFHLGEMYADGVMPSGFTGDLLTPDPLLSQTYFKRCQALSPTVFAQLHTQREQRFQEIRSKLNLDF